jgi:hypothetical protein
MRAEFDPSITEIGGSAFLADLDDFAIRLEKVRMRFFWATLEEGFVITQQKAP